MKTIDLFAGCGGMSMGFERAGFTILRAYDNWKEAIVCYEANFDHTIVQEDLNKSDKIISALKGLEVDIIIGGPPCQDFSHAGKRTEGDRASLTESYAEIVSGIMPAWYVMENVDRAYKSESYRNAKLILKSAGYGITEMVLDASYCGVPQKRKRFFSIGKLDERDDFLNDLVNQMKSEKPLTLRDYFGNSLGVEYYYRHPRNYSRRAIFSIDEPAPTMRGVNRPVPAGYPGHHGDPVPVSKDIRPLSTQERALIQTFPEDFIWIGSKTDVEQMIGNAVPVNLASFVGEAVMNYHLGKWEPKKNPQLAMSLSVG